ncbi:MAG TPA: sugar porter family MFS transporter [Cyclobacteriaceae bacterium]|nr:sugar porter family MFS transporter [Cyclobacteriaceae bacterium]
MNNAVLKQQNNMRSVFFISLVAAMGGFLFGFDTAVISGAEQTIQQLWQLSDFYHGLAVAIALYGTVLGALFGGWPSDRYGRKITLVFVALLYLVSAIGSALANDVITFMIFRFIGGLGVGASSVAAPMYISEISPARLRGRMVGLFQFNVVLGIVIAYVSNYFLKGTGDNDWRLMLGVEAVPALLFMILLYFIPESPRWLIVKRNDETGARAVMEKVDPANVDRSIKDIKTELEQAKESHATVFFSKAYFTPIMLAVAFAFFNQMAGINAIIYYAPRIFELTGLAKGSALISTIGIGVFNLIFTLIGMTLIDRSGRRILMLIGSFGLIVSLGLVARAFLTNQFNGVPIFLFIYIAFFAMSQGAVIWVFISEIFPNEVRANGQSLGSFTHWILNAFIANFFPFTVSKFGGGVIFAFFTFMMILQLLFVWRVMPETKGKSLEEIGKGLKR